MHADEQGKVFNLDYQIHCAKPVYRAEVTAIVASFAGRP
jgi:hypothetical protein